jgi:hypothetical protein
MEIFIATDTASVQLFFNIIAAGIETFVIPWDHLLNTCVVEVVLFVVVVLRIISIKVGEVEKAKDVSAPLRIPIDTDETVDMAVVPLEGVNGNMGDDDIVAKKQQNQGFPFRVCGE